MEASDRRSERTTSQLANQNFLAVIQHGRSTPIALNPFMSSSYDIDYKQLPGFDSYGDSVDHFFDQIA